MDRNGDGTIFGLRPLLESLHRFLGKGVSRITGSIYSSVLPPSTYTSNTHPHHFILQLSITNFPLITNFQPSALYPPSLLPFVFAFSRLPSAGHIFCVFTERRVTPCSWPQKFTFYRKVDTLAPHYLLGQRDQMSRGSADWCAALDRCLALPGRG